MDTNLPIGSLIPESLFLKIQAGNLDSNSSRLAKRLIFRIFLPVDLQLKLIKIDKWNFGGELIRRRYSNSAADLAFFDFLRHRKLPFLAEGFVNDELKILFSLYEPIIKDLTFLLTAYEFLDWLKLSSSRQNDLAISVITDLGLAAADKNPFLAREIKDFLNERNNDFGADLISFKLGEDQDKILADIDKFLASGEYYAAGKLAILTDNQEAVKYCLEKLMEILNFQPLSLAAGLISGRAENIAAEFFPKILSPFYPISKERAGHYLVCFLKEIGMERADQQLLLSFSFVELIQSIIPEDKEFGRKLFNRLLKSGRKFEAAMAAIPLGEINFSKRVSRELRFANQFGKSNALILAIGYEDPELGRKLVESWLEKHLDPILPPIAVAKLAAVIFGKAVPNEKEYQKMSELIRRLSDSGGVISLYVAGMLAISIKNYDLFPGIYDKLNKSNLNSSYMPALTAAYLKEINFSSETKTVLETICSISKETRYLIEIVTILLLYFPFDISSIRSFYLPNFLEIKSLFLSTKDRISPITDKEKIKYLDRFSRVISNLQFLFPKEAKKAIQTLFSRGILNASVKLLSYENIFSDVEMINSLIIWLKPSREINSAQFLKLLDLGGDYFAAGYPEIFRKIISKKPAYEKLILELEKRIKIILFKKLGIKENGLNGNGLWPKNYPVYLLGHDNLLRSKRRSQGSFYRKFLRIVFANRFQEWISDPNQEDKIGRKIALHNQKVEKEFLAAGVNWEAWNNPGFEELVSVEESDAAEIASAWQFLEKFLLTVLLKYFEGSPLLFSLKNDIIAIQKQKNSPLISEQDLEGEDWIKKVFPVYSRSLESMEKSKKERKSTHEIQRAYPLLFLTKDLIKYWLSKFNAKKSFQFRIWDRNPSHDLFQGNYSKCCLALGVKSLNQDQESITIMDYLVDKGIQVLEIIDEESQETIGQCWPFLSRDESGKLLLAIDSVDLDYPYRNGTRYNLLLRDGMFQFLKRYAKAIAAEKIVLGATWHYNFGEYFVDNKVPTNDLLGALFPKVEKLGGYWNSRPYFLYMENAVKGFLIQ